MGPSPAPNPGVLGELWGRELELGVVQHAVEQNDELAHGGRQRDEGFFAGGAQAGVELAQNAVVAHGAECGHVERTAHRSASAADVAGAFARATIAIVGRQASERSGFVGAQRAQLGHLRLEHRSDDRADPGDLLQTRAAGLHRFVLGDLRGDGALALHELPFQEREQRSALLAQQFVGVMLRAIALGGACLHELAAAADEHGQVGLRRAGRRRGCWSDGFAKSDEHCRIDGVGLGMLTFGTGKMPCARGLDEAQGPVGGVERAAQRGLVASGGFQDDVDPAARPGLLSRGQQLKDAGMAFGVVAEAIRLPRPN